MTLSAITLVRYRGRRALGDLREAGLGRRKFERKGGWETPEGARGRQRRTRSGERQFYTTLKLCAAAAGVGSGERARPGGCQARAPPLGTALGGLRPRKRAERGEWRARTRSGSARSSGQLARSAFIEVVRLWRMRGAKAPLSRLSFWLVVLGALLVVEGVRLIHYEGVKVSYERHTIVVPVYRFVTERPGNYSREMDLCFYVACTEGSVPVAFERHRVPRDLLRRA